jgi:hypothetical protein
MNSRELSRDRDHVNGLVFSFHQHLSLTWSRSIGFHGSRARRLGRCASKILESGPLFIIEGLRNHNINGHYQVAGMFRRDNAFALYAMPRAALRTWAKPQHDVATFKRWHLHICAEHRLGKRDWQMNRQICAIATKQGVCRHDALDK